VIWLQVHEKKKGKVLTSSFLGGLPESNKKKKTQTHQTTTKKKKKGRIRIAPGFAKNHPSALPSLPNGVSRRLKKGERGKAYPGSGRPGGFTYTPKGGRLKEDT